MGVLDGDRRGYLTPIYGGELKEEFKPKPPPTVQLLPPPKSSDDAK